MSIFKDTTKAKSKTFDLNNEIFPELQGTFTQNNNNNKKQYSSIVLNSDNNNNINNNNIKEKIHVPPGCVQYIVHKNNKEKYPFTIIYGDKTKSELDFIESQKEPQFISCVISTLKNNWESYQIKYDKLHGEGAYDLIYYSKPIYPSDEYDSDSEPEADSYDNDDNYDSYDE